MGHHMRGNILKTIVILFLVLSSQIVTSASFSLGNVLRSENIIVLKTSSNVCYATNLENIRGKIPESQWIPVSDILQLVISSPRPLTEQELTLCGIRVPTNAGTWRVAFRTGSIGRPVYRLVTIQGKITHQRTSIRLPSGAPCAQDETNTYSKSSSGGREWRNTLGATDYTVLCELQ